VGPVGLEPTTRGIQVEAERRSALLVISALRLGRMSLLSRIESSLIVIVQRRLMGVKRGCRTIKWWRGRHSEWAPQAACVLIGPTRAGGLARSFGTTTARPGTSNAPARAELVPSEHWRRRFVTEFESAGPMGSLETRG
jgi:hypothetical protein